LALSRNKLEGPLPAEVFSLRNLRQLSMGYNRLTGTIPREIGNLTLCQTVELLGNKLGGPVPTELGLLRSAVTLDFRFQGLTGTLPPELAELNLEGMYFSFNDLTGTIPSELGKYTYMSRIELGHNRLEGSIPPALMTGWKQWVELSHNQLTGSIPPEVTKMPYLRWLFLGHNKLSGTIPTWNPENLYLQVLSLDNNKFTRSMPEYFPKHITFIDVHSNRMDGAISPSTFSPLSRLEFLLISDNDFTGSFPQLPETQTELKVLAHANLFSCKVSPSGPKVSSDVILGVPGSILEVPLPEWYIQKDPLADKKNLLNDPGKEFKDLSAEVCVLVALALIAGVAYRREFYRFLFSNAKPDARVDIVSSTLAAMLGLQSMLGVALTYLYKTSPQRYDCGRPLGTISATYITGNTFQYVAGLWALALPAILVGIWHIRPSAGVQQLHATSTHRRTSSNRRSNGVTTSLSSVDERLEDGSAGGTPAPAVEQQVSLSSRTSSRAHQRATDSNTPTSSHPARTASHASHRTRDDFSSWASDSPVTADTCCKRIVMWLLWMLAVLICAAPGVLYAFGSAIPLTGTESKLEQWLPVIAAVMTSLVQPQLAKALGKMQARRQHTIDHTKGRLLASAGLITWLGPMVIVIFMSENCGGYWWNFYDKCRSGSTAFDFCDSKLNKNIIGCSATTEEICGARWMAIERCTMSIMDVLVPLLLSKLLAAISLSLAFLLLCRLLGGETSINLMVGRRRIIHYDVLANFREAHSITNLTIFGDIGLAWAPISPPIAFAGFCYVYTLRVGNALTKNAFGLDPSRWSQASPAFSRVYLFSGVLVSCTLMVCHVASAGDDRPAKTAAICLGAVVFAAGVVIAIWRLQIFCEQRGAGRPEESENGARTAGSEVAQCAEARNLPLLMENSTSMGSEREELDKSSSWQPAELAERQG